MTTQRRLTEHAATAKAIRAELKEQIPSVKFRVRSQSFSMGNAVDVFWNGEGTTEAEISAVISKYQYGRVNSMTDGYDMTNSRSDLPQVKYVHLNLERGTQ